MKCGDGGISDLVNAQRAMYGMACTLRVARWVQIKNQVQANVPGVEWWDVDGMSMGGWMKGVNHGPLWGFFGESALRYGGRGERRQKGISDPTLAKGRGA